MYKKSLAMIYLLLSFMSMYAYEQDLLKTSDVSGVMQKILSEHVEKKEVTEKVLHQAFEVFINQFDPHRIYLLQSEVAPYFNPTQEQLDQAIQQYKKNDFSKFFELNKTIQTSIDRSRRIRDDLENNIKINLFHPSSDKDLASLADQQYQSFAKNKEELKERILLNLAAFIDEHKERYGKGMTPQRKEQILDSYELKLRDFENQYLYQNDKGEALPPTEQENLFALHILKGLTKSLDTHTSFFKPSEAFDIRVRLQKEFKGIGLVLKDTNQGVVVVHLLEGGPAEKSQQIHVGDILIEVDGKAISGFSFDKTMELLHGEKNEKISLKFKRQANKGESESTYTVVLNRETIVLNKDRVDVSSFAFGDGIIGVITLHSFYQGEGLSSEQDVRNAIDQLQKKGNLKGLILDLRENGGGFLSQAVKVAGLFITDGIIVISKYSNGEEKIYRDVDGKTFYDGPLVVLTSKATASAAEIVAQALQDYGVALVVGDEQTYGKGTIQSQTVTNNQSSSYFKVTVGKYYTVSGHTPQREGVKADIIVPSHWHKEKIGEKYTDSLEGDIIPPSYDDSLQDIPSNLRSWYIKYYIPKMQKRVSLWRDLLPTLRKNSEYRIANNKNYQFFLKGVVVDDEGDSEEEWGGVENKNKTYGEDDLQVQEAVNIVKDMILLNTLTKK